jgi:fatty-acyl-CoA synthase
VVCLFPDVGHISVLLSEGMARVSGFGSIPRTPTSFLTRAGAVHGDRVAVVEGEVRHTYGELLDRSRGLAGGLRGLGIDHGDRVSVLAPNSSSILEAHLEAHFGVPWSGGVLNALKLIDQAVPEMVAVEDENSPLALDHMSGTTGRPKGGHVLTPWRVLAGARHGEPHRPRCEVEIPVDASDVPQQRLMLPVGGQCRGRPTRPDQTPIIWQAVADAGVTHLSAAPTVLSRAASEAPESRSASSPPVRVTTGGTPPSPTLPRRLVDVAMDVTHPYGLTETYGPAAICDWRPEGDKLDSERQSASKARQGVANIISEPIRVHGGHVIPPRRKHDRPAPPPRQQRAARLLRTS